jgi:hypothetical protein
VATAFVETVLPMVVVLECCGGGCVEIREVAAAAGAHEIGLSRCDGAAAHKEGTLVRLWLSGCVRRWGQKSVPVGAWPTASTSIEWLEERRGRAWGGFRMR